MNRDRLELEFLGTGTSSGVPQLRCGCEVCRSTDSRDKRFRTSAIVRYRGKNILIDCGPDFRTQMLRASSQDLDALLITHIHYDHVGGLDDIRAYCLGNTFPIYARADVIAQLREKLPYCFHPNPYTWVPLLEPHSIVDNVPFTLGDIEIRPIPIKHFKMPIIGFHIGPLAYITDCKTISDDQVERLRAIPLLVLNALRVQDHVSHLNLEQALALIERIRPGRAFLIHMGHDIGLHSRVSAALPENVALAYDGLVVQV